MQSSEPFDVAVIGAGAMGAAAAWRLARRAEDAGRPARVLLLDRFAPGHDRGSSHGASRITRLTYEHADYVRLAREAFAGWEEVERDANEPLFFRTGDLIFGPADGPVAQYPRAMASVGVPLEPVSAADLARRFPQFRVGAGDAAFSQPSSGVLASDRCVAALLRGATRRGVTFRTGEQVTRIDRSGDPLRLETASGASFAARRVIVAAGPWVAKLLPELALPVVVVRQDVLYFLPQSPDAVRLDRFPVWIYVGGAGQDDFFYGLPIFGVFGAKVARHRRSGTGVDPDVPPGEVGPAAIEDARRFCAERLPALADALLVHAHGCAYTVTPDEDFVIDLHPADARIVVASCCSGHGFKFAPAIGKVLADLALDGRTDCAAYIQAPERFALARFAPRA